MAIGAGPKILKWKKNRKMNHIILLGWSGRGVVKMELTSFWEVVFFLSLMHVVGLVIVFAGPLEAQLQNPE